MKKLNLTEIVTVTVLVSLLGAVSLDRIGNVGINSDSCKKYEKSVVRNLDNLSLEEQKLTRLMLEHEEGKIKVNPYLVDSIQNSLINIASQYENFKLNFDQMSNCLGNNDFLVQELGQEMDLYKKKEENFKFLYANFLIEGGQYYKGRDQINHLIDSYGPKDEYLQLRHKSENKIRELISKSI